ncbi:hypothetical protein, partial [Psittacicella hinzii]
VQQLNFVNNRYQILSSAFFDQIILKTDYNFSNYDYWLRCKTSLGTDDNHLNYIGEPIFFIPDTILMNPGYDELNFWNNSNVFNFTPIIDDNRFFANLYAYYLALIKRPTILNRYDALVVEHLINHWHDLINCDAMAALAQEGYYKFSRFKIEEILALENDLENIAQGYKIPNWYREIKSDCKARLRHRNKLIRSIHDLFADPDSYNKIGETTGIRICRIFVGYLALTTIFGATIYIDHASTFFQSSTTESFSEEVYSSLVFNLFAEKLVSYLFKPEDNENLNTYCHLGYAITRINDDLAYSESAKRELLHRRNASFARMPYKALQYKKFFEDRAAFEFELKLRLVESEVANKQLNN